MGKSKKSDTVEETCPSVDHDKAATELASPKSKIPKTRTAVKSDKSRKSNRSKVDTSHDSSATLKPTETKKSRKSSKSRQSRDSTRSDEECQDTEHESSSDIKSKESKKPRSSSKSRKSRDSSKTEEACLNADHNPSRTPEKSTETKTQEKSPRAGNPEECHNADHQSSDGQKSSTTLTSSTKPAAGIDGDHDAPPKDSRKAEKEKEKAEKRKKEVDKKYKKEEEKKAKEENKKQKDMEKKHKKAAKTGNSNSNEDDCVDTDHWLSSSDAKKLKKLIKSRDEKAEKPKEPENAKSKDKENPNGSNCPPEHTLSQCDPVQTNDGAASRKASKSDPGATPKQTPAQAFPRGIQIMAKNTNTLEGGFPYPKELAPFGITKQDWSIFCHKLTEPLASKKIAYAVEKILDICAEEDVKFFRPKGFIMRLDMPGEEQYGLDIMDMYHSQLGSIHTDNFTSRPPQAKEYSGAIKHKHHIRERSKDRKHLESLRDKAFRSTRLMLDPIIVLRDPELAARRGWARWIIACNQAQKLAGEAPPKRMDNKPWYGYFPTRWDRWPPSKHLYYDRFRGSSHPIGTKSSSSTCIIPDYDSMDQRGSPYTSSIIPCDEVEFAVLHSDQP
ncbi:hypothetical protein DL95DRAFT_462491 [Leptodontidium sp. 2 PMI_412]|nr:hypothetical protein DL95DRAFT_462491 [Leptodontidium sp. 2 PMI_412]